jgi:hypothetical protein
VFKQSKYRYVRYDKRHPPYKPGTASLATALGLPSVYRLTAER